MANPGANGNGRVGADGAEVEALDAVRRGVGVLAERPSTASRP